ncbi:MAG: MATE family efflux transporter [Candidatus Cloacimonetes bacterium]|nr:MATE family efflux transporter [Candidatus Cloacimonadota bacterium]
MTSTGMDLTQGNLLKNLVKLSLPIMLSNFFMTFYNLTDAFWLGKLGETARHAVSVAGLAFPLIFFLSSFGFGFVIAGTSLIAQYKGAGKMEKMKEVVGQFVLIIVVFSIFFVVVGLLFINDILKLLQTPDEIFDLAKQFITIILMGMIFMFIFLSYQSFSHGLGDTISPMKIQLISVGLNVILDPLMIFGIGFFPRMETLGAAWATLISRIVAAIIAVIFLFRKTPYILPGLKEIKPEKNMMKRILRISIPASLAQSMTSFGFILLQGFVNSFGTVVMSAYAINNRLISLFMMPSMGISNGLASIVGQNIGAQKYRRAEQSVSVAFKLVISIMFAGSLLLFFFGGSITKFFINDPAVIAVGVRMFKVTPIASCIFGVLFVFIGAFNGSGHTKPVMLLNVGRLWFVRIPLVYILSGSILHLAFLKGSFLYPLLYKLSLPLSTYPYESLWWSMVASNMITSIIAYMIYKRGTWKRSQIKT